MDGGLWPQDGDVDGGLWPQDGDVDGGLWPQDGGAMLACGRKERMGLWPSSAMMLALQLLEPGRACGRKEWMGLWPSSAMMLALLLEPNWLRMGTRTTTTMIAICVAFRRPSGSMAVRSH